MTPRTYGEMVLASTEHASGRTALILSGERRTYAELVAGARRRLAQLHALSVRPGDRFGLLMPNSVALVEYLLAAALGGATAVPINTRFKPPELRHVIDDAEFRAVITTGTGARPLDLTGALRDAIAGLPDAADPLALSLRDHPHLRAVAAWEDLSPAQADAPSQRAPRPDDPLLIMYTSGTTAHPKGCVFTSHALALNAAAIVSRLEIPDGDRWWDPLPLFHMGGIMLASSVLAAAGTFVTQAHFTVGEALALIESERPEVLYPLFPTITMDLLDDPSFAVLDVSSVRLIGSVAPPDVQARIQDALPRARVFSAYGITELCGCVAFNSPHDPAELRLRTCGRAMDGFEMHVIDPDTGEPCPPRGRGELIGRGPQMFACYFGNAAATAAVVDADGYFHTGDLCSIDTDGVISYHGRIKDMLKVGGENVSAIEVESLLATHPGIKLAQVVGIPDPRLIEVPVAFVELAAGHTLSEEDVIAHCTGRIASFKVPRGVRFVSEWPMSATKIQKFRLRERLLEELAASPSTSVPA